MTSTYQEENAMHARIVSVLQTCTTWKICVQQNSFCVVRFNITVNLLNVKFKNINIFCGSMKVVIQYLIY